MTTNNATAATPAKTPAPKPEVDLTRKTPYGTKYRVVRTASVKIGADLPWLTICLDHDEHVASKSLRDACLLGTKGRTAEWCSECGKLRDGKDKPAAIEPVKTATRRSRSKAASKEDAAV